MKITYFSDILPLLHKKFVICPNETPRSKLEVSQWNYHSLIRIKMRGIKPMRSLD